MFLRSKFRFIRKKRKQTETIDTAEDYFKIIKSARKPPIPPFTIIRDSEITVHDFELHLPNEVNFPKSMLISEAVKICYFPNGQINVFKSYTDNCLQYTLTTALEFDDLLKTRPAPPVGILTAKVNDVKSLLKHLSQEAQQSYNDLFESSCVKPPKSFVNNLNKSTKKCQKTGNDTAILKSDKKTSSNINLKKSVRKNFKESSNKCKTKPKKQQI